MIEKLGAALRGYREGERVIAGAITPSGYSNASLDGVAEFPAAGVPERYRICSHVDPAVQCA